MVTTSCNTYSLHLNKETYLLELDLNDLVSNFM